MTQLPPRFSLSALTALVAAVCSAVACSDEAGSGSGNEDADVELDADRDRAVDLAALDPSDDDPTGDAAQGDGGPGCAAATAALAAELYDRIGACTVAVRLDYQSRAILGHEVFCGAYAAVDEAQARARADSDTGYGDTGSMLNEAETEDYYVFYLSPGDFGGAAAVSAKNGLSVFGGGIVWAGAGAITYPEAWRDPGALASGCDESGGFPASRGWDLRGGVALSGDDVAAALAVVAQTAVAAAFWQGGYVFDAVVLLYPRSVGELDPTTAEWIVLVSGGWLE